MKICAFILACVVLALSCLPCMDGAYAMGNAKEKVEASTPHNPIDKDCTDDCSPFCFCNCCSGFVYIILTLHIGHLVLPSADKLADYLPAHISEISLPVWQPPQLV